MVSVQLSAISCQPERSATEHGSSALRGPALREPVCLLPVQWADS